MVTVAQMEKIFKEVQPHFVHTADVEGYASLFTADAVWWPLNRETRIGPKQIAVGFAQVMVGCKIAAAFDAVELHESESTSIAILLGTETISFDNGDPTQVVHSREIWMFRDERGLPKICRMIWNQDPAAS